MTKEMTKKEVELLEEWYIHWHEVARAIIFQTLRNSRIALIEGKWKLGEHIETHIKDFNRSQIYGKGISKKIANDIGITEREINSCRQFYRYCIKEFRAKDWERVVPNLPEELQISWNQIKTKWLPQPKERVVLPEGKFQVVYADPPWPYPERQDTQNLYGNTDYHYDTIAIKDLCQMEVSELADENSVLFLWVATNFLEESFGVLKSWGFNYKSQMAWVKEGGQGGIGWYFWGDHELLLVATRGSFLPKEKVSSVLGAPRRKHSQKPDEVYGIIEKMYPGCKYLELFARNNKKRPNWTYWGDQANK